MSKHAFPTPCDGSDGMTLRDWFAGQALSGMTANPEIHANNERLCIVAYSLADAMIKEREQWNK